MTSEQRDIALMVSLLLAWTSSWTNSWVASHEITMMMVIRSRDSSPFTTAQWCLFNANQKKLLSKQSGCIQWHFDIEALLPGESSQFHPESGFFFVNRKKICWTNSQVASDFQWKLCFWRGYQIMTSDQRNSDQYRPLMFSFVLACTSS